VRPTGRRRPHPRGSIDSSVVVGRSGEASGGSETGSGTGSAAGSAAGSEAGSALDGGPRGHGARPNAQHQGGRHERQATDEHDEGEEGVACFQSQTVRST